MTCRIPGRVISATSTLAMIGRRSGCIGIPTIMIGLFVVLRLDLYRRLKLKGYPLGGA